MATEKLHIVSDNIKYRRTPAERNAGVSPTSYVYDTTDYGDMRRYGLPVDGTSTCTAALNSALVVAEAAASVGGTPQLDLVFPRGTFVFSTKPNDIVCPVNIRGPSERTAVLVRDYTPAAASDGLLNLRAGSTTSPIGCKISNLMMGTGSGRTAGCLISAVQPSSGDGADGLLLDNLRLTNSVGLGGTGNGPDYMIYLDGSARSSPAGLRRAALRDCEIFGAAVGAVYARSCNGFFWSNCYAVSSGSLSGAVTLIGTSSVTSNDNSLMGGTAYGLVLDYLNLTAIVLNEINGSVSTTANVTNTWIRATGQEMLFEKAGGNVVTARYSDTQARGGLYAGGTSGAVFVGGNLTHDTGNTFDFEKTGLAWFVGDPTGAGELKIGCATGTAGDSAGVGNLASQAIRITTDGNIYPGRVSATNMTNGFIYVPSGAGNPSGTPTAITGYAPLYVDTTNNKLFFYSSAAWRDAGP